MNIKLSDNLRIKRYDAMNIIIEQDVIRKKKETEEEYIDQQILGYYPTVESALRGVINKGLLESKVNTLEEYINDIRRIKDDLKREVASECEV